MIPFVYFLSEDEQLLVKSPSRKYVVNGPRIYMRPFMHRVEERRFGISLKQNEYVHIRDTLTGEIKHVEGPGFHFLDTNEEVSHFDQAVSLTSEEYIEVMNEITAERKMVRGECAYFLKPFETQLGKVRRCVNLSANEFIHVKNQRSGEIHFVDGPCFFFPELNETVDQRGKALSLGKDEYIVIKNLTTGEIRIVRGETAYKLKPFETYDSEVQKSVNLLANQFMHVKNNLSGEVKMIEGPCDYFLDLHERILFKEEALNLGADEYIEILDQNSGVNRIIRGEMSYKLKPYEVYKNEVQKSVKIDEHTAVIIRDNSSGELRMETKQQSFCPAANESIVEVRKKVLVEEHEVAVLKDNEGHFHFHHGNQASGAFFVPPYWEMVKFHWSSGLHKNERSLVISKFDLRPKFMWYEFDVRTWDNVELELNVTFFWQVDNVELLIKTTDDASGDVCSHARSRIIQKVSQVEFSDFLQGFNSLIREAVLESEDTFYADRGITIHSVEVREIGCKDQATQDTLSEIIQETTTRINRIQKQISENEVMMKRIEGELLAEEQEMQLVKLKAERHQEESRTQGLTQAQEVSAFLDGLGDDLSTEQKLKIFEVLRKKELMEGVAGKNTRLFITPDDVDLKLDVQS